MIVSVRKKNILVYLLAIVTAGLLFYFYYERDRVILESMARWGKRNDTIAVMSTPDEKRIAAQFADSTLPELRRLGLITTYTRTDIETIITVSGAMWNERSDFFKESFLTQIYIYNKVNGFSPGTKIYDEHTSRLLAQIIPPDRKEIY